MYREYVMDICQSIDISWQESKPNRKNITQVHERQDDDHEDPPTFESNIHKAVEDRQASNHNYFC